MYKSINSTLGKQRQEDQAFKVILGVICQHEASDQEKPLTNINRHAIGGSVYESPARKLAGTIENVSHLSLYPSLYPAWES